MIRSVTLPRGFAVTAAASLLSAAPLGAQVLQYPSTPRVNHIDDYHGTPVADPYRWLEDVDSPETMAWVEAQNRLTFEYLGSIPERERIHARLTELWNYPKYGVPFREGGHYFLFKNDGLQNQAVLYTQPALDAEPRVLLDPNTLSKDGTVALSTVEVSPDGTHLVYGTSSGGSDWQEFRVRQVNSGHDLSDHLRWIKFSGASWTRDGRGFFYARYPEPQGNALTSANRDQKLFYHRLGTDQAEDMLVYQRPDQPEWGFGAEVTEDGRYLVIGVWHGTDRRNRLYYMDLQDPNAPRVNGEVVRLLDDFDATYRFVGNHGPVFYVQTDLDAPRGRVIAIDTRNPERARWRTVIPQTEDALEGVSIVNGHFVARYLHDAHARVRLYTLDGRAVRDLELPTLGSVGQISGKPDDEEMFYSFTSFLYPTTVFRYDFATGKSEVFRQPELAFDADRYVTEQVFYRSKDGTRVPMFITRRKDLPRDGQNPTLLYGYGGFNVNVTPSFSVRNLAWVELGGIYAVPNLRGGAEYGEEWHQGGMLENKQNVFDDFIAAAEFLIREGYTSPSKLAVHGGSNGGLLVGAVMTQRPELFGAALPAVGVMDMLRYHKFTIGWAWASEYGSADDPEQFRWLYAYSPLHNLKPGTRYPATLVTTADHDDRVVPGHSFKFAAALQHAHAGEAPVLIRVDTRAGHGAGKPTSKQIDEAADILAFLVRNLGLR